MMVLPDYVLQCMILLEKAGAQCFAVGGCVRDAQLGLVPHDYDLCTSFTPEQTKAVFEGFSLVLAGEKHGTVGVVRDKNVVEITTFRTEGSYHDSRHPDWVEFVGSIEEDLARRDFTVNAMAYHPQTGLVDPFGGREDLKNKVLRAVGEPEKRFREDALRILRGVRFAVRFGLTPEEKTEQSMITLASLMDQLARERVFEEICGILPQISADELIRYEKIITTVIPELAEAVGFDQKSSHHQFNVYEHVAHVVAEVKNEPVLRFAALLHDVGKPATFCVDDRGEGHFYGHAKLSAQLADGILRRLKAPTALRDDVVFLVEKHMDFLPEEKKLLRRRLAQYGSRRIWMLLDLQRADRSATSLPDLERFDRIAALLREIEEEANCLSLRDLAVGGNELMALGYSGRAIGEMLNLLLDKVIGEEIANDKETLLRFAQQAR